MSEFYMYIVLLVALGTLTLFFFFKKPKHQKFTSMKFLNVLWCWKWRKNSIIALAPYCLTCKEELEYDDEHSKSTTNLNDKTTFLICTTCKDSQKGRIQGGGRDFAMGLVKREIYRQINTKEYEKR